MIARRAKNLVQLLANHKMLGAQEQEVVMKAVALQGASLQVALLENTKLSESVLNNALAKVYNLKTVEPKQFAKWSPKNAGPVEIGRQFPLAVLTRKDKLWVIACADPDTPELHADVPALLKGQFEWRVVSEVRLAWMRAHAYGVQGNMRIFSLFSRLDAMPKKEAETVVPDAAESERVVYTIGVDGDMVEADTGDLMDEAEFSRLYVGDEYGSVQDTVAHEHEVESIESLPQFDNVPPSTEPALEIRTEEPEEIEEAELIPLTRDEAIAELAKAGNRDDLANVLLGFARNQFARAVLLSVDKEHIVGWAGNGSGIRAAGIESIWFAKETKSVFKTVCETRSHFLGPLPASPVHDRFLQLLGGEIPAGAFVMPLLYDGEVSQILWLDNGDGQPAGYDISDILILAVRVPAALDKLVEQARTELAG